MKNFENDIKPNISPSPKHNPTLSHELLISLS